MKTVYDIAIIGGGASGLAAAVSAAKASEKKKIVILEGNKKLGKKLLATGNGRCNLSNSNACVDHYFGDTEAFSAVINNFSAEKATEFFGSIGLITDADSEGRLYPYNRQAASVLATLSTAAEEAGVTCIYEFNAFSIIKPLDQFIIKSSDGREIAAKACILACGGKASPKLSCGSEAYAILKSFGHTITDLYPVLVQLKSSDKLLKNLSGMRCRARVKLIADKEIIREETGELLFADKALSGICVFNLSIKAGEFFSSGTIDGKKYNSLFISADLAPDFSCSYIKDYILNNVKNNPNSNAGDVLAGFINMKVGREIVRSCKVDTLAPAKNIDENKAKMIAERVKELTIKLDGTRDWQDAQVTAGGVPVNEIDCSTLESRKVKKLYICGELLNIHGECGGYNLHFAWLTGIKAGTAAALMER